MSDKQYFPMYVDLREKQIVLVGAGTIAERRVNSLLPFGCHITVIAPDCTERIALLAQEGKIRYCRRCVNDEDVNGADIVLAAASDSVVNDHIYELCKSRKICVNHAGNQEKCDFYFPALIFSDDCVIGICSGGKDHRAVRKLREYVQGILKKRSKEQE